MSQQPTSKWSKKQMRARAYWAGYNDAVLPSVVYGVVFGIILAIVWQL